MSVDAILKEVDDLTPDEQAELFQRLQERFREPDHGLSDAQMEELKRRVEEYRNNPNDVIPWEVVKENAAKRARR